MFRRPYQVLVEKSEACYPYGGGKSRAEGLQGQYRASIVSWTTKQHGALGVDAVMREGVADEVAVELEIGA